MNHLLTANILAEIISNQLNKDELDFEINLDDYFQDIKPHLQSALVERWDDDLKIVDEDRVIKWNEYDTRRIKIKSWLSKKLVKGENPFNPRTWR